jgi:hypothetical protein
MWRAREADDASRNDAAAKAFAGATRPIKRALIMTSRTMQAILLILAGSAMASCEGGTGGTAGGGAGFDEMRSVGEQYEPDSQAN